MMPSKKTSSQKHQHPVNFFFEEVHVDFDNKISILNWIVDVVRQEQQQLSFINFIFCDDDYLLKINIDYLNHHDFTDVISFPYDEDVVEGDVFISVDRVKENANTYNVDFFTELYRVMVHGTLHLVGYQDKLAADKSLMSQKEDFYLKQLFEQLASTSPKLDT